MRVNTTYSGYPFGMVMPNRQSPVIAGDEHRYGYNSEQKDDEIKGEGNSYDYGNRMYDPRVGRFLSLDAYAAKYPSISPYVFAINSPIMAKDVGGDSVLFYSESGAYLGYSNDNMRYKGKNLLVIIDDKMVSSFNKEYNRKRGSEYTKDLSPSQIEAHVAGLEAMGTSIDVTDFVDFFNEYRYKKMGENGVIESVPVDAAARNYAELFEWTADIYNKAVNSRDKNGSVAVDRSTADSDNISNHVVSGESSVWGFEDFHTHSSENLDPDPSKDDKTAADMHGNSDWHIVVGEGMFTLFRDANPKISHYSENRQIESITIFTKAKGGYTDKINRQDQ